MQDSRCFTSSASPLCNIQSTSCSNWHFSEAWKMVAAEQQSHFSAWGVLWSRVSLLVEFEEPREKGKVHQVITPLALVLGSLGCSGLGGKLLHQTRVSSTGCLTGWLPCNTSKESHSAFLENSNEKHTMSPAALASASEKSYVIE